MADLSQLPPPPAGYTVQDTSGLPPPPAGYTVTSDSTAQPSQGFLGDVWTGAKNTAKDLAYGAVGAAAGANKLTANAFDLLDKAATHIANATGTTKGGGFKQIADWARTNQQQEEQQQAQLAGGRNDFMSQVVRGGTQGLLSIPQYAVAGEALGPVAGMGAISALEQADKGPGEALKAGAQGALMGGAMKVLGPGSRLLRGGTMGAGTTASALLSGADPTTAIAQGVTMGGMAGMGPGGKTLREAVSDLPAAYVPKIPSTLNPVEQRAVDYARSQGVPLRAGTITGNRAVQALEQTTASSPLGAQRAAQFNRGTEEGFQDLGERLATQAHPDVATPETVGQAIPARLQGTIETLSNEREAAYERAWQGRDDPQHTYNVPVRMVPDPQAGEGEESMVPVMRPVNMPVDVREIKAAAEPIYEEMQWMPAADQASNAAFAAVKKILQGDDFIPAWQAERGLSGLKETARVTSQSGVRDLKQGVAASLVPRLQEGIDAAVANTGDDALDGLRQGRALHARVMGVADLADQLRDEPVQNFGKLTQQRDTGITFQREIAQQAPELMPALGRAWLQRQLDTATAGGGFAKTTGLLNNWLKLGDSTKEIMFPDPALREAIGNFLKAADMRSALPNPSGTEIVRQATSMNPTRWAMGYLGGRLFYTPEGINLLTDAIKSQSPGSQALNMAKVRAAAGRGGPPEPPPEPGGPAATPPAGGPPAGPEPPEPATTPGGSPSEPAPGSGLSKLRSAVESAKEFWRSEEGSTPRGSGMNALQAALERRRQSPLPLTGEAVLQEAAQPTSKLSYADFRKQHPEAGAEMFDLANAQPAMEGRPAPPRYEPPRGVSARVADALAKPSVRRQLDRMVAAGQAMMPESWYRTGPLYNVYKSILGEDAAAPAFERLMQNVAATSPVSRVPDNARIASFYNYLDRQGLPIPDQPPPGYGSKAQQLHRQNAINVRAGGLDPLQNPKPFSFTENLLGNETPVTIDTHNFRMLGMASRDPRFLATSAVLERKAPDGSTVKYTVKPRQMYADGKLTMAEALKNPVYWDSAPAENEYGAYERAQQGWAKKKGLTPAGYQEKMWVGGGEQTGLGSASEPFLRTLAARIHYTAARMGVAPDAVLEAFVRGKIPLLSILGGAAAGVMGAGGGRQDDRQQAMQ